MSAGPLRVPPPFRRIVVARLNIPGWEEKYLAAMRILLSDDEPPQDAEGEEAEEEQEG